MGRSSGSLSTQAYLSKVIYTVMSVIHHVRTGPRLARGAGQGRFDRYSTQSARPGKTFQGCVSMKMRPISLVRLSPVLLRAALFFRRDFLSLIDMCFCNSQLTATRLGFRPS